MSNTECRTPKEKTEYRISNVEHRMPNAEVKVCPTSAFDIRCSIFDIRLRGAVTVTNRQYVSAAVRPGQTYHNSIAGAAQGLDHAVESFAVQCHGRHQAI